MNKGLMKNTGVGIFFILFALVYLLGTSHIKSFSPFGNRGLDSQSIPQMLGVLMIALSGLHVAITARQNRRELAAEADAAEKTPNGAPAEAAKQPDLEEDAGKFNPVVWGSIILLIAYAMAYQRLGFLVSTAGYLLLATTLLTPKEDRKRMLLFIVPFSFAVTAAIYIIFTKYLTLFLPRGIWG